MGFLQGTKQHLTLQHRRAKGADGCKLHLERANTAHREEKQLPGITPGHCQPSWQSAVWEGRGQKESRIQQWCIENSPLRENILGSLLLGKFRV